MLPPPSHRLPPAPPFAPPLADDPPSRRLPPDPPFGPPLADDDQNLLYCNNNPDNDPCPICAADIGRVFIPGTEPRLPRHDNCYCYYVPTSRPPTPLRATPR